MLTKVTDGYHRFRQIYRRHYITRIARKAILDGIKLDLRDMSPKVREVILKGSYERDEKDLCAKVLDSHDSVLEIGASIGFIGLFCQMKLGVPRYASIEANQRTFQTLLRNYELNGVAPNAWHLALAESDGQVQLEVGPDSWGDSIVHREDGVSRKNVSVQSATLDTIIKRLPWSPNTLIIDIEGGESCLLASRIPDSVSRIIIEMHPRIIGADACQELKSSFTRSGFLQVGQSDNVFSFFRS